MKKLTASVIICTRNRLDDIKRLLVSLAQQTTTPEQIIIIDSSDVPLQTVPEFSEFFFVQTFPFSSLLYQHTQPGLTYQRNIGIGHAQSDIVYFIDDDAVLAPNYIEQMQKVFQEHPEYAGGMGSITNIQPFEQSIYRILRIFFLGQRDYASGKFTISGMPTHAYGTTEFKEVEVLGGCCMAYRLSIFAHYKFDERLTRYGYMEDCDFSRRVSYKYPLFFNPRAQLQHFNSPIAREVVVDNRAMLIKNYSYLFFKNFYSRNRLKLLAYVWSIIGFFAEAFLTKNWGYIRGYCKGLTSFYWYDRSLFRYARCK
jgi:GT2 family glycosyltransferase